MARIGERVIERWAAILLLVYPALMLTVRGGMNTVFILALLSALLTCVFWKEFYSRAISGRELGIFSLAMLGLLLATFISQTYWQSYLAREYDAISRYWLAIPLLLWFSSMPARVFVSLQLAFPIASIIGFVVSLTLSGPGRTRLDTLDPIHFGDVELLLGFMSLYSLNWFGRDRAWLQVLKIVGFIAGLSASLASGSRGGWLAIPVLLLLQSYFISKHVSWKRQAAALFALVVFALLIFSQNDMVRHRTNALLDDIQTSRKGSELGHLDTSFGVRWQLYGAAINIFIHHPFFGAGPGGFAKEMGLMQEAGLITPQAAELGRGEVHNDILAKAASAGSFGLIAALALYAVPFALFWKASQSSSRKVRRTGILGLTFVSGIATFGLTVEFLNLTMAAAFYAFTVAVLLAGVHSFRRSNKLGAAGKI